MKLSFVFLILAEAIFIQWQRLYDANQNIASFGSAIKSFQYKIELKRRYTSSK